MRNPKSGISHAIARMTVLPLLLFGIVTMLFSFLWIRSSMEAEVQHELKTISDSTLLSLDKMAPGEYAKFGSDEDVLYTKGDMILNHNYEFLDSLKETTGMDYTLFLNNMRVITTLYSDEGNRLSGTYANEQIVSDVVSSGTTAFYSDVDVYGKFYYCYYTPLMNQDGVCVGMFAVLMPSDQVHALTLKASLPILALTILATILAGLWSLTYSKQFVKVIQRLQLAFDKTAKGQLSNNVPADLLARKDEFGAMSHSLVDMQRSLRSLVEQDMLTGLNNRRFGQQKLAQLVEQTQGTNKHFSIALGDIDFFKKFNDTYGHDCGDYVLKEIASLMKHTIKDYGYCIRWGGEEFLIVLTNGTYEDHKAVMNQLILNVRANQMEYDGQKLSVTMTFGLIDTTGYDSEDAMVIKVDDLLYYGKEHGRNQLVTLEDTLVSDSDTQ